MNRPVEVPGAWRRGAWRREGARWLALCACFAPTTALASPHLTGGSKELAFLVMAILAVPLLVLPLLLLLWAHQRSKAGRLSRRALVLLVAPAALLGLTSLLGGLIGIVGYLSMREPTDPLLGVDAGSIGLFAYAGLMLFASVRTYVRWTKRAGPASSPAMD